MIGLIPQGRLHCISVGRSSAQPLSKCELCSSYVRPDRMRKHISKAHGPSKRPLDTRLSKQPIRPPAMTGTNQTTRVFLETSRPCSCNGNNPNCSWCNGLGTIAQENQTPD